MEVQHQLNSKFKPSSDLLTLRKLEELCAKQ